MSTTVPGCGGQDKLALSQLGQDPLTRPGLASSLGADSVAPEISSLLPPPLQVSVGGPGDHPSIHLLLQTVFHGPSAAEFQAQLDDPYYEPCHRIVVKRSERIVSHVRLSNRVMNFGLMMVPVALVSDLATLPEYSRQGCATAGVPQTGFPH